MPIKGIASQHSGRDDAAIAVEHGLTVVTRNRKDFGGLGANLFDP